MKDLNLPFYLTGGTAISRFYYNHRYSDDLDFFINNNPKFIDYVNSFINHIRNSNYNFNIILEKINVSKNHVRLFIQKEDIELKVDFVNDIASHFGELKSDNSFGFIDSIRNILSNKLSAIYRFELKDFVDIWIISNNYKFNWNNIINEAKSKEVSVDPIEISKLFISFPFEKLDLIKWINPFVNKNIKNEFEIIAKDIISGNDNSLFKNHSNN